MLEEALNDYCKASQLNTKVDAYPIKAGVILWWLGRAKEAIETWRGAIDLQYTDPAGGITIPALLLFAGVKQGELTLAKDGQRLLQKRWKPKIATTWPGPIAGFLLGHLDEATVLTKFISLSPPLEARRLSQAHFWIGFNRLRHDDKLGYTKHLHDAVRVPPEQLSAVSLEAEYWLALAENENHDSAPPPKL
jgi:hypothetical protein